MIYPSQLAERWLVALLSIYLIGMVCLVGYVLWAHLPDIVPPSERVRAVPPAVETEPPQAPPPDSALAALDTTTAPDEAGTPPAVTRSAADSALVENQPYPHPLFDLKLFLVIVAVGAIGGLLHAINSLTAYVGNKKFVRSWVLWYLFRPVVGALLATLFYLAFRGGLLPAAQVEPEDINVYGLMAIAGLVGLFSDKATLKLKEIFEAAFRSADDREHTLEEAVAGQAEHTPATTTDKRKLLQAAAQTATPTQHGETAALETLMLKALPQHVLAAPAPGQQAAPSPPDDAAARRALLQQVATDPQTSSEAAKTLDASIQSHL